MKVTKEQFEEIDEMYNNGEISLSEASLRRDNLERRRKEELLEIKSCPNCGEKISYGVFSKNELLSHSETEIINEYIEKKSERYCQKCGKKLYYKYCEQLVNERKELKLLLERNISNIPVISIHSPLKWNYKVLGMVTGQTTTGTGVLTEFTSSFTDFFGVQSGRHNKKLKEGEDMCKVQLRTQTLNMGGNAVVAADIDYSEVGAGGMLMVCMTGTAINLENIDIIGKDKKEIIKKLNKANERLNWLSKYKPRSGAV